MKSYIKTLRKNIIWIITFIILFGCITIGITAFAIPDKYDSTYVISVNNDVTAYKKALKNNTCYKYVDQLYGFNSGTTKESVHVSIHQKEISIRARNEDAITSKKIADTLIKYLKKKKMTNFNIKSYAKVSDQPSYPNMIFSFAIGAFFGALTSFVWLLIKYIKQRGPN